MFLSELRVVLPLIVLPLKTLAKKVSKKSLDPAGVVQSPKTPESRKYEKITPRVGPRKTYRKNTKLAQSYRFFLYFLGIFFSYFRGPTRGGGFCIFSVIFSYFRESGVFGLCTKVSGESPETVWSVFLDFFWTFWRLFRGHPEVLGDIFKTFLAFRGPEGPRDPRKGRAGSQPVLPSLEKTT